MKIYTGSSDIYEALRLTKIKYPDVEFNRMEAMNSKDSLYTVTLKMASSRSYGARLSHSGRRMNAACWHVHGYFMDNFPEGTKIVSLGHTYLSGISPWRNWNAGSIAKPIDISRLCLCDIDDPQEQAQYKESLKFYFHPW